MALKHKINKAAYDKLSDELKAEYMVGETDGEFVLDVTGLPEAPDVGAIQRALENERTAHKTTKTKLSEANTKLADVPDVEAMKAEFAATTKKLTDFTHGALVSGEAKVLAAAISTAPALMADHIAKRLSVDMTGDVPKTVILGADGKPDAAMTIDKLKQEFVANKDFAPIIKASNARGGGAPLDATKTSGGRAPVGDPEKPVDASTLSGAELAARITAKREAKQQQQQGG